MLKFAISDLLSKKELQNLSRNTLKGYAIFFREFKRWTLELTDASEVTQAHILKATYCITRMNEEITQLQLMLS
ncbi:hypothetical protein ACIQXG_00520 [Lysinibacillus sphaericus]|uniref:hypothetical protein n=1 Tax=Lysinibacillus sphaericus TaxID=1421 RepID=UPI00380DFB75